MTHADMALPDKRSQILIVGCGRVGAELALSLSRKEFQVVVVDPRPDSFDRLGPHYHGRTVTGSATDRVILERAGIQTSQAFAAVTSSDNVNVVSARVARDMYRVEHVVARIYNPERQRVYELLGVQTVASSSWGAQRIEHLLLHPGLASLATAGNGEVTLLEVQVPVRFVGRPLADLTVPHAAIPAALIRSGEASLPEPGTPLQNGDLVVMSVLTNALPRWKAHLSGGAEEH